MDSSRILKRILYEKLAEGMRSVGRPELCTKDQCKTSMVEFSINVANCILLPGIEWDGGLLFWQKAKSYDENTIKRAVEARQKRKWPTVDDSTVFY